ncbi:MAG: DUF4364 family protein [Clostridia bacterium]|nr:DUF4364 family protein [Clostridia bacterium]
MISNSNNTALAENKVLILYILNQIDNYIIEDGLFKIISPINDLNYFYFKQVLNDLIESKLVGLDTKDNETVIKITSKGQDALSLTQDIMPGILKLKADNIFKKELSNFQKESSVSAEFIPKSENEYIIKCKIIENNETIFEVKTIAGSRERAKKIVDNWNSQANKIYPDILNILLNDSNSN